MGNLLDKVKFFIGEVIEAHSDSSTPFIIYSDGNTTHTIYLPLPAEKSKIETSKKNND